MKKLTSLLIILLVLGVSASFSNPNPDISKQKVRTFINLLDYIGKDYPRAVQDGEIISEFEYNEMVNFSRQVAGLHGQLSKEIDRPSFANLTGKIAKSAGGRVHRYCKSAV